MGIFAHQMPQYFYHLFNCTYYNSPGIAPIRVGLEKFDCLSISWLILCLNICNFQICSAKHIRSSLLSIFRYYTNLLKNVWLFLNIEIRISFKSPYIAFFLFWKSCTKNKLGLNWAKLSSSWYWTLLELSLAKFLGKFWPIWKIVYII